MKAFPLILILAVLTATFSPKASGTVEWSFVPLSSVMPPGLPEGQVVELGGQGTFVVKQSPGTRAYHLVHEGSNTLLFAEGDPAPGGGTFIEYHSVFNLRGLPFAFYAVSANLVYFHAIIDDAGSSIIRFFRWHNGTLTHLPNPDGVTYDITRNDGAGKFLAYRQIDQNIEYWITDGVNNSPSINFVNFYDSGPGYSTIISYTVLGITAGGGFLIAEVNALDPLGCVMYDTTSEIYYVGSPEPPVAKSNYVYNDCEGKLSGDELELRNANPNQTLLLTFYNWEQNSRQILMYDATGASTLVAQSEVFQELQSTTTYLTHHPQAVFRAMAVGDSVEKWYVGPTANDRFGGDFLTGFGQSGEVDHVHMIHPGGKAVVTATLADGSTVQAIGSTRDGVAPSITSDEPPPGNWQQEYSFQFSASGSPTPTFRLTAGELPPGLTLAGNGLLSGKPTDSGEFTFTLEVSNGVSPDATREYTLEIRPRLPVIFIHGVAGSVLKTSNRYIWPTVSPGDVADLHILKGPANTEAVDVVREYDVGGLGAEVLQFYGPFLRHMTEDKGYVEYDLEEDRNRLTNFHLLNTTFPDKPDLFTFPYDWRRPNAGHVATLHTFIQRIRALHDGAKVNLVAHSMGGLVMRRYLLEYGSESVERVVTVGSPVWGAPESAFRMFTGIFFGVGPIDFINSRPMRESVLSMPAVHELNPSSKYLQYWGFPVFQEVGTDYNDNGLADEGYSSAQFRVALDEEASPQTPATNNIAYHGYLSGRQDDWSQDDGAVGYLHIIGKQAVDNTTVGIEVRSKTFVTPLDLLASPKLLNVFSRVVGEGDGTVPTLGSLRLPQYYAPGTIVREITEPLAGVPSQNQPPGQAAEHTMLMSNTDVWSLINEFLDTGTLAGPMSLSSRAKADDPAPLNVNTNNRRQILVAGCPWVAIRDTSTSNIVYGGIASSRIPGVDVLYNSEEDWVLIEFDANMDLWVERGPGCEAVEIEVIDRDASGEVEGLRRYRFDSGTNGWQLALGGNESPSLRVDEDGNGAYDMDEEVAPTHVAQGPETDTLPPVIDLQLSRVGEQVRLALAATDSSEPIAIWVSIDGGLRQLYETNLFFEADAEASLAIYAEDALGNTSGLIQTRINPALSLAGIDADNVVLEWPTAYGYRLESASAPGASWSPVSGIRTRRDGVTMMTADIAETPTVVYRLVR